MDIVRAYIYIKGFCCLQPKHWCIKIGSTHSGTCKDKTLPEHKYTWNHCSRKFTENVEDDVYVHSGMHKINHRQTYRYGQRERKQEHDEQSYGAFKRSYIYVLMKHVCAFNVSEIKCYFKTYHTRSFLSTQIFMCKCACETTWALSILAWQVSLSSFPPHLPQAHRAPLSLISVLWDNLCLQQYPESRAQWWTETSSVQMHTCIHSNTHTCTHKKTCSSDRLESPSWASSFLITAEPCGKWEEWDKDGWVMIKEVVKA